MFESVALLLTRTRIVRGERGNSAVHVVITQGNSKRESTAGPECSDLNASYAYYKMGLTNGRAVMKNTSQRRLALLTFELPLEEVVDELQVSCPSVRRQNG